MKIRILVTLVALAACLAAIFGMRFHLDRKLAQAIAGFSRYEAAEARANRPLDQRALLTKWLREESANHLGDPALLGYFSAFPAPHSANPRADDPLFAAALDRFAEPVQPGMEFSFVPFAIGREPFIPPACAFKKLDEAEDSAISASDPRGRVHQTLDRHRRLAAWNHHCCGIYELVLRSLDRLGVCGSTLNRLQTGQLAPGDGDLALMQACVSDSCLITAFPNALLYERTFIVANSEKLIRPEPGAGWHPLTDLRREEARHLLLQVMGKALEAAATTPPCESPTASLDHILSNADSVIRSSRTLCPAPGLQSEWDQTTASLLDARMMAGFKTTFVKEAAYQAVLAAYRQRQLTGNLPVSLTDIQPHLLSQSARTILHEANARLVLPENGGSPRLRIDFTAADGAADRFPNQAD